MMDKTIKFMWKIIEEDGIFFERLATRVYLTDEGINFLGRYIKKRTKKFKEERDENT